MPNEKEIEVVKEEKTKPELSISDRIALVIDALADAQKAYEDQIKSRNEIDSLMQQTQTSILKLEGAKLALEQVSSNLDLSNNPIK